MQQEGQVNRHTQGSCKDKCKHQARVLASALAVKSNLNRFFLVK